MSHLAVASLCYGVALGLWVFNRNDAFLRALVGVNLALGSLNLIFYVAGA